jgi:hypothetical protein
VLARPSEPAADSVYNSQPVLGTDRLRTAAVAVSIVAGITSFFLASYEAIQVYNFGWRFLTFGGFGGGLAVLHAGIGFAFIGGVGAVAAVALRRWRLVVGATVTHGVAALTVAGWLDVQHLEAFASYRQPQDPSLGLQTAFTVAGFAAALVVAVMAVVVVVRYARASRQVADPVGRAFQPVFSPATDEERH